MNKKLIVAAVSAAVALPVVAQAEITVYGRVNNAIDINDLNGNVNKPADGNTESTTDVTGIVSRFGLKGTTDIGNGLTAHGRYEFETSSDNEGGGVNDTRIATAGVSGSFGRIDIGNQWSAYFNTFGTQVSPSYSIGFYLYSSAAGGPYRASNTIKYSNSFGGVALEVDVRLNDDASPEGGDVAEKLRGDGFGVGITFPVTSNITIALAADSEDRDSSGAAPTLVRQEAAKPTALIPAVGAVDAVDAVAATADTPAMQAVDAVAAVAEIPARNAAYQLAQIAGDGTLATLSAADTRGRDEDRFGAAIRFDLGSSYWLTLGWQNYKTSDLSYSGVLDRNDDGAIVGAAEETASLTSSGVDIDSTYIYGGGNFNPKTNWVVGLSDANDGRDASNNGVTKAITATDDSSQVFWGVYHNVGGGLRLYYEAVNYESENAGKDGARHLLGMRVDF